MKKNIVVIGAGIIGTSIAYHLAMRGIQDVVLIDKGDLDHNDGSTSHAPGGLRTLTPSKFFTKLGQASRAVYDKLPLAVDGEEQFFRTGMVQIANTEARFNSHKRLAEFGMMHGIEAHLLGPNEVADKLFLVDPKTVYGGIYIPDSGTVKTGRIATSMRREAEKSGHLISLAETEVIDVEVVNGRVTAIITSNPAHPRIDCEMAVLATNIWAPILANKVGMPMPLFPGEHQYIYTEPTDALNKVKETENTMPVTAFDDISVYFRQHNDRIGIGSYHHEARLVDPYKLGKEAKMPFTPEDFTEAWRLMQGHMPLLQNTNVSHGFNGMFAFTVDHYPIMGEAKVKGFWAAVGAWLSFASGVGEVMTRWMIDGDPGMDVRYADINRFHPHQLNHEFLSRQSKYFYEIGFDILHPNQVASSVRNLRFSPYHHQMEKLGGEFVPFASIETPYWYSSNQDLANKVGEQFPHRSGYDATAWTPIIGGEVHAMRESVGIVDWSAAIGPVEISGPKALEFLQTLCSSNIERPVGGVAYSLMLNVHGKIMRDVTILRKEENVFWLLTGKANLPSELYWIEQQAAGFTAEGSVKIVARGEEFVSIALWGPNARKVLEKVTHADVSNEAFPWYTAREIGIGMAPTTTVRISYVGELGYEIYAPVTFGSHLWDTLWEAGQAFGVRPVGIAALMSMRIEKGYRLFGADLTPDENPVEVGMGRLISKKKPAYIGREAALKIKAEGTPRKMVTLVFDDPSALCYGLEPVYAQGEVVGRITSGEFGYAVGTYIAYALVDKAHAEMGTELEVMYTGSCYTAKVSAETQFDPENARIKG